MFFFFVINSVMFSAGSGFGGAITNISFNGIGSAFAVAAKDKKVRIVDPRAGKISAEAADHPGTKGARVIWLGKKDKIVTCGFDQGMV
jgi:hypothetical protein